MFSISFPKYFPLKRKGIMTSFRYSRPDYLMQVKENAFGGKRFSKNGGLAKPAKLVKPDIITVLS